MKEIKLDHLGRIVIPISIRKNLDMKGGTPLTIEQSGNCVTIRLVRSTCRLCGSNAITQNELMICDTCIQKIKNL